jgi:hypothetical protein
MTNKIKILIGIIVLEIGLLAFSMQDSREYNSLASSSNLRQFALTDSAEVNGFVFGKNTLQKTAQGWIINGKYPADAPLMRQLFLVLQKIEIKKTVSAQMKKDLAPQIEKQGIDIQFLKGNTPLQSFRMLNKNEECYITLPTQGEAYVLYVPGYNISLSEVFNLTEGDWREKTVIATRFLSVKKIALSYADRPQDSFIILKDSTFFKVDGLSKLDSNMVGNYVDAFKNVRVFSFIDRPTFKDSLEKALPYCTLAIEGVISEQSNSIKIYTDRKSLWGIMGKTDELVELEPRYFTRFLVRKKDFEK